MNPVVTNRLTDTEASALSHCRVTDMYSPAEFSNYARAGHTEPALVGTICNQQNVLVARPIGADLLARNPAR